VIAELIAAREYEITIKSALGAYRLRLAREMIAGTLCYVIIGEVTAVVAVFGITRLAADLFYGVSLPNPAVAGSVAAFVFALSVFAGAWPAWRAASGGATGAFRRHL